jgi:hypothetical protein
MVKIIRQVEATELVVDSVGLGLRSTDKFAMVAVGVRDPTEIPPLENIFKEANEAGA